MTEHVLQLDYDAERKRRERSERRSKHEDEFGNDFSLLFLPLSRTVIKNQPSVSQTGEISSRSPFLRTRKIRFHYMTLCNWRRQQQHHHHHARG